MQQSSQSKPSAEEVQAVAKRVHAIDLEPIAYKLVHPEEGQGWSPEEAYAAVQQYRCFLILNELYPGGGIVPTKVIDQVWHKHILDTAKYREDCDEAFGRFIDHFPYFGLRGDADAENLETAFQASRDLFIEHFDMDPSVPLGAKAADCGSGSCSPSCSTAECGGCSAPPNCQSGYKAAHSVKVDYQTRPSLAASLEAMPGG